MTDFTVKEFAAVQRVDESLLGELGQGLGECLADQVAVADELRKCVVGQQDLVISAFEQRHESGGMPEHDLEPFALANLRSKPVQHRAVIQQRRGVVTGVT